MGMDAANAQELRMKQLMEKELDDPLWSTRLAGMQEVASYGLDQVARCGDKLVDHALRDGVPEVRQTSYKLLASLLPQHLESLHIFARRLAAEGLDFEDRKVRAASIEALSALGPDVATPYFEKILPMLKDHSSQVRKAATRFIGLFGDPTSLVYVPTLYTMLLEDYESEVRAAAADGLGFLRVSRITIPGESVFGDQDVDIGAKLRKALSDVSVPVRCAAATALSRITEGRRFADALVQASLEDKSREVRAAAAAGLATLGDGRGCCLRELGDALRGGTAAKRRAAAEALGRQGAAAAPEARRLSGSLQDPDEEVREAVVLALRAMGKSAAHEAPWLAIAAVRDSCAEVQRAAVDNLRLLGEDAPDCCPDLAAALLEEGAAESESLRFGAVCALGAQGLRAAPYAAQIAAALKDRSYDVRRAAAEAMGEIGVAALPHSEELLTTALHDEDCDIRRTAVQVLGMFGTSPGSPMAAERMAQRVNDRSNSVRLAATEAIGNLDAKKHVALIVDRLVDNDKYVCCAAARVLGAWGEVGAAYAAKIVEALQSKHKEVRIAASEAIRDFGTMGKDYLEEFELNELASKANTDLDHDVRRKAAEAIRALGEPDRLVSDNI